MVSFDWNGETIRFSDWSDDDFGEYHYTTRDCRYDFEFELRPVGREVRVYILFHPDYGGRQDDPHSTHRLHDSYGEYVCVRNDLTPTNVPDALSWLVYWAEETGKYIDTGRAFS